MILSSNQSVCSRTERKKKSNSITETTDKKLNPNFSNQLKKKVIIDY
jgi:hypothetical protein